MGISYKLDNFEGPLDLLLHLIDKNKVNIYDIPIATITEQYLDYVNHMETEDLNIVSEFLVMAATLIDIKARMLLPRETNEEGEEEDPRAELVARLLEYKYYKYMSLELKDREVGAERLLYKSPSIPPEVAKYEPPLDLDKLLDGLTLAKLQEIFRAVTKRKSDRVDPIRSRFGNIRRESISLEDKIKSVMDYARVHRKFSFRGLLERQPDRTLVVVTFLALLELMKIGKITLTQEHLFDDMFIETLEPEGEEGELDLSELQEETPFEDTFMPGKQGRKEKTPSRDTFMPGKQGRKEESDG
ncbi:MAG: segregation/condensation protein A [Hungatella sp.]|jgi:segregation and condensation protein A|nr:segregation/condensation protein A [Hungatella sp.]